MVIIVALRRAVVVEVFAILLSLITWADEMALSSTQNAWRKRSGAEPAPSIPSFVPSRQSGADEDLQALPWNGSLWTPSSVDGMHSGCVFRTCRIEARQRAHCYYAARIAVATIE